MINDRIKAGEETTLSLRGLNMKCHEVHHFTFKWFDHNEHVHMCVTEKSKQNVSQLRRRQPLALKGWTPTVLVFAPHGLGHVEEGDQRILTLETVVCQGC